MWWVGASCVTLVDTRSVRHSNLPPRPFLPQDVFDILVKADSRIKHHVINLIAKELTDLSTSMLRSEFSSLRLADS